jgi:hypothetical protein
MVIKGVAKSVTKLFNEMQPVAVIPVAILAGRGFLMAYC